MRANTSTTDRQGAERHDATAPSAGPEGARRALIRALARQAARAIWATSQDQDTAEPPQAPPRAAPTR